VLHGFAAATTAAARRHGSHVALQWELAAPLWHNRKPTDGAPLRAAEGVLIGSKDKATSLVIAHLAGVSQPTVSRALRGSPMVNEATRTKILKIARELNYKVDKNASNLRFQHSGTLALLLFEDPAPDDSLINPFFVSMLASITRACGLRGYDLLISFQQPANNDWQASFEDSNKADGIILLGYGDYLDYRRRLEFLNERGIHFVRWGAALHDQAEVSVGCDNYRGGYDVTGHLLACGARRIAFIGDASNHYPEFLERYRGHGDALAAQGLVPDAHLQVNAISSEQSGFEATATLIGRARPFDAICAASDLIAIGAMKALQAHGLRVPDDVLVSGFDDIPLAAFVNPSLTTVQQDTKTAGAILVDTLLKLIRNETADNQTIPVSLLVRDSTTRRVAAPAPASAQAQAQAPAEPVAV
jgi:DNA-binding LacI/PurR family transcriptional regulator